MTGKSDFPTVEIKGHVVVEITSLSGEKTVMRGYITSVELSHDSRFIFERPDLVNFKIEGLTSPSMNEPESIVRAFGDAKEMVAIHPELVKVVTPIREKSSWAEGWGSKVFMDGDWGDEEPDFKPFYCNFEQAMNLLRGIDTFEDDTSTSSTDEGPLIAKDKPLGVDLTEELKESLKSEIYKAVSEKITEWRFIGHYPSDNKPWVGTKYLAAGS